MAQIMVAGGYDETANHAEELETLGRLIGDQLIRQGHDILTGGQTELDRVVAEAAAKAAEELGSLAVDRVTNYVLQGQNLKYEYGRILRSQLDNWDRIGKELRFPEPIYNADVIILLGGWEGTYRAANWARIADKPIVPIAGFGLAAEQIYQQELNRFNERYADLVEKKDYELLNQIFSDVNEEKLREFAAEVVSLAERIIAPNTVFVVMSFSDSVEFQAIYRIFKEVTEKQGFDCYRVDQKLEKKGDRIIPAIIEGIRKSAFIIADVTDAKPNVYYELGLAHGAIKPVILTAKTGTPRPFDIFDLPIIYWSDLDGLAAELAERVNDIAKSFGR
jgi:hypothetical protein